jgi:ParB family chromosome partitioning protein
MPHHFQVPLSKLVLSPKNVRKADGSAALDELAASIAAVGLINALRVEPDRTADGRFTDQWAVLAGGRRWRALKRNVELGRIEPDFMVDCIEGVAEQSLAENSGRLALHPCDQCDAFAALAEAGATIAEIAQRYGLTERVVEQRLKLATVSPRIREQYRAGKASLDQMMALTLTDDIGRQDQLWFAASPPPDAYAIRRLLTEAKVATSDRRVRFVGIKLLQSAGVRIERDLFDEAGEGYITDIAVLDRLVAELLEFEAAKIAAEGWAWVETKPRLDFYTVNQFSRRYPEAIPLGPDDEARQDALMAEYESIIEAHGEDLPDEAADRLTEIQQELDRLDERDAVFPLETLAIAGALVAIGDDGSLRVERGMVRPEERRRTAVAVETVEGAVPTDPAARPLSAALVADLTAHRTAGLQATVSERPEVALRVLAHALALDLFYPTQWAVRSACLIPMRQPVQRPEWAIGESRAGRRLRDQHAEWQARLPAESSLLWSWLVEQNDATIGELLAVAVGRSLDAILDNPAAATPHADQIHDAVALDMADWWSPKGERYVDRVPKLLILEALSEAVSPETAHAHRADKKAPLAEFAGERLEAKRWLPAMLRAPVSEREAVEPFAMAAE